MEVSENLCSRSYSFASPAETVQYAQQNQNHWGSTNPTGLRPNQRISAVELKSIFASPTETIFPAQLLSQILTIAMLAQINII